MMDFEFDTAATTFVVVVATVLACVVVTLADLLHKSLILSSGYGTVFAPAPVAVVFAGFYAVGVLVFFKSFIPRYLTFFGGDPLLAIFKVISLLVNNVAPIAVSLMSRLETRSLKTWMIGFFKSFVPTRLRSKLSIFKPWVMTSFIFRDVKTSTLATFKWVKVIRSGLSSFTGIYWKGIERRATAALTELFNVFLFFRSSHTVHYTGKQEESNRKLCELLGYPKSLNHYSATGNSKRDSLKSVENWAISSQASWEQVEGSTTNAYDPDRIMKRHERTTRKRRYSLSLRESVRSSEIKKAVITLCPYTGMLDDLSEQPVREIIRKVLKNDAVKAIETEAHDQFKLCALRVTPTGGNGTAAVTLTTNGTSSIINNLALGKEHIKTIVDAMKERNIAPYMGDDYYAIAWPTTYRTFKNNLEGISQYIETGFAHIMNGEVGRYEGTRFTEQTYIARGAGSTANAPWENSLSDWCFFMGEDTVTEAIAVPEEIRGKIPTQYGLSRGVAWYALLGFGLVHTQAMNSAKNSRIVMWDSAS